MPESLHPALVIRAVSDHFGIPMELLMSRERRMPVALYRQVAMYLSRQLCSDWSLPMIGRVFERDHTTIMYAQQKLSRTRTGTPLARDMQAIVASLHDRENGDDSTNWLQFAQMYHRQGQGALHRRQLKSKAESPIM